MSAEKPKPITTETKIIEAPGIGQASAIVIDAGRFDDSHHFVSYQIDAEDKRTAEAAVEIVGKVIGGKEIARTEITSEENQRSNSSSTVFDARKWGGCNWEPKGPTKIQ